MIGRRSVWSNARVQALAKQFVPAADEVWFLQHADTPEARWFRAVAAQGHYKDRGPDTTRQGIYAAAPSGVFLASINHNAPERMAAMLERALAKWRALSKSERLGAADAEAGESWRWEQLYPHDGLVLRSNMRDLPRTNQAKDWRGRAWNQDFVWFRKDEMQGFLPDGLRMLDSREVPEGITHRLARFNLVDTVRGQSPAYPASAVRTATLRSTVINFDGDLVGLKLEGRVLVTHRGRWRIQGLDTAPPLEQMRSVQGPWLGRAVYDTRTGRFAAFELVWLGMRFGATRYNCRADDQGRAPMGVAFTLAGDTPADRVAPANLWSYGWRVRFPRRKK